MLEIELISVVEEDFTNYKEPAMLLGVPYCDFKCCNEARISHDFCQNYKYFHSGVPVLYSIGDLYLRYVNNKITKAIVFGGMEPMFSRNEVLNTIHYFRNLGCNDPFIVYTGYTEEEIESFGWLDDFEYENIIFKFGRYVPNDKSHFDEVLGVQLISSNQYGKKIS